MFRRTLIFLVCVVLSVSGLWGGGWNNTLMGCRAIAIGGAFAGLADDPSAIFYNPAGHFNDIGAITYRAAGIGQQFPPRFDGNFYPRFFQDFDGGIVNASELFFRQQAKNRGVLIFFD